MSTYHIEVIFRFSILFAGIAILCVICISLRKYYRYKLENTADYKFLKDLCFSANREYCLDETFISKCGNYKLYVFCNQIRFSSPNDLKLNYFTIKLMHKNLCKEFKANEKKKYNDSYHNTKAFLKERGYYDS